MQQTSLVLRNATPSPPGLSPPTTALQGHVTWGLVTPALNERWGRVTAQSARLYDLLPCQPIPGTGGTQARKMVPLPDQGSDPVESPDTEFPR